MLTNLARCGVKSKQKHSKWVVQSNVLPLPSASPEQVRKDHRPSPRTADIHRARKQARAGSITHPHTSNELPDTTWWTLAGVVNASIIFSSYIIYYLGCFHNLILNLVGDFQHNWRADTLFPLLYWSCFSQLLFRAPTGLLMSCQLFVQIGRQARKSGCTGRETYSLKSWEMQHLLLRTLFTAESSSISVQTLLYIRELTI